jgi:hypothetical protein
MLEYCTLNINVKAILLFHNIYYLSNSVKHYRNIKSNVYTAPHLLSFTVVFNTKVETYVNKE